MHSTDVCHGIYSRFAKIVILGGVPLFITMGFGSLALLIDVQNDARALTIFVVMAAFFLGLGWFGIRLLPFLSARIVASSDGLHIFKNNEEHFHRWSDLSHFVDRQILQVLDIYAKDG